MLEYRCYCQLDLQVASIRRKPGTRYLVACFTDTSGVQRQRSTRTTDRRLAGRIADDFERAYRNRQTEFQIRRVLSGIHEELHGRPMEDLTPEKYCEMWLARKKAEVSGATYKSYASVVPDFVRFIGDAAKRPMLNLRKADVEAYRDHCAANARARTANNKLKVLRTFLQSAWADELIPDNPAAKVRALKTEKSVRRGYTMAEIKSVLAAASEEWRGIILAGFYTGQRLKDIVSATGEMIDRSDRVISFSTSKTDRAMLIPIADPLWKWLEKHTKRSGPIFPKAHAVLKRTDDTSQLSDQFYEILVRAKLRDPRPTSHVGTGVGRTGRRERSPLTFHSLRHTATSALKTKGVSDAVTRDIIGHDSVEVSQIYTHIDHETKRKAIQKLPDIT